MGDSPSICSTHFLFNNEFIWVPMFGTFKYTICVFKYLDIFLYLPYSKEYHVVIEIIIKKIGNHFQKYLFSIMIHSLNLLKR